MITIELLKRAGVSDELIARVIELEQAEISAKKRELRRLRNRRYQHRLKTPEASYDKTLEASKTQDASSVLRRSQRLTHVDSTALSESASEKYAVAYRIEEGTSKEERKKESYATAYASNSNANSSLGSPNTNSSLGPANGHCFWTEAGLNSPDGRVTISQAQIADYAQTYPGLTNVEGQIKSALHFFNTTDKTPGETLALIAPWLAKREQEALDKKKLAAAKANERAKKEAERAATNRKKGGEQWSDVV